MSSLEAVSLFYNRYCYPDYPLFLSLRWQDGYHGSTAFAADLCHKHLGAQNKILIAGCGAVQPYILSKIEPLRNQIYACDLAANTLKRARLRTLLSLNRIRYFHSSIQNLSSKLKIKFDHIDSYGVIHHNDDPLKQLSFLAKLLKPKGTLRLMVYNHFARKTIQHLQNIFKLAGFNSDKTQDVVTAQKIFAHWASLIPAVGELKKNIGEKNLYSLPRFADTFLHPKEARVSYDEIVSHCKLNDLRIIGLFDRYGELDDLKNPLWNAPSAKALNERLKDRRFENNYEIYLCKLDQKSNRSSPGKKKKSILRYFHTLRLCLRGAPRFWRGFHETRELNRWTRQKVWIAMNLSLHLGRHEFASRTLSRLSIPCLKRLARLGAITRMQAKIWQLEEILSEPIHAFMESPSETAKASQEEAEKALIYLEQYKKIESEKRTKIRSLLLTLNISNLD